MSLHYGGRIVRGVLIYENTAQPGPKVNANVINLYSSLACTNGTKHQSFKGQKRVFVRCLRFVMDSLSRLPMMLYIILFYFFIPVCFWVFRNVNVYLQRVLSRVFVCVYFLFFCVFCAFCRSRGMSLSKLFGRAWKNIINDSTFEICFTASPNSFKGPIGGGEERRKIVLLSFIPSLFQQRQGLGRGSKRKNKTRQRRKDILKRFVFLCPST